MKYRRPPHPGRYQQGVLCGSSGVSNSDPVQICSVYQPTRGLYRPARKVTDRYETTRGVPQAAAKPLRPDRLVAIEDRPVLIDDGRIEEHSIDDDRVP